MWNVTISWAPISEKRKKINNVMPTHQNSEKFIQYLANSKLTSCILEVQDLVK